MEQSSVPGTLSAWPDVLHDGPTPLVTGEAWIQARIPFLASMASEDVEKVRAQYRAGDAVLESWRDRDEVVFWFEHDLFDQLLLIRHLWWLTTNAADRARYPTRFSLVCGTDYIGLLKPEEFPPRFDARQPITPEHIRIGAAAWEAYCSGDPAQLMPFAASTDSTQRKLLPYLAPAIHRVLEEFPSTFNGLARSQRQILEVLVEGPRTPEQAFIAASRLEEAIYMGDLSFWEIVTSMRDVPQPLVTVDARERPGRLPDGTLQITATGRAVLDGRADHVALNGISRWLGGTQLSPDRVWRWTGSSLQPPVP